MVRVVWEWSGGAAWRVSSHLTWGTKTLGQVAQRGVGSVLDATAAQARAGQARLLLQVAVLKRTHPYTGGWAAAE